MNPVSYEKPGILDSQQIQKLTEEIQKDMWKQIRVDIAGVNRSQELNDGHQQSEERKRRRNLNQRNRNKAIGIIFQMIKAKLGLHSKASQKETLIHALEQITYYQEVLEPHAKGTRPSPVPTDADEGGRQATQM